MKILRFIACACALILLLIYLTGCAPLDKAAREMEFAASILGRAAKVSRDISKNVVASQDDAHSGTTPATPVE